MSMTRKEAIKIIRRADDYLMVKEIDGDKDFVMTPVLKDAINLAITALCGPTREMVERMFPGCDNCKPYCGTCESMYGWDKYGKPQECDGCKESGYKNYKSDSLFCECCGKPLTDKAVDMMLERWKEAVDGEQTD